MIYASSQSSGGKNYLKVFCHGARLFRRSGDRTGAGIECRDIEALAGRM
jgi:hypothetical protein